MAELSALDIDDVPWDRLESCADRQFFQSRAWLTFLARTQQARPVVAVLHERDEELGWFTGLEVRHLGVRILGAPFPGWQTPYLGFNLHPGVPRAAAIDALAPFAFGDLGCSHLEVCDRWVTTEDLGAAGFAVDDTMTFVVDLAADDATMLARMNQMCRRNIRLAERAGVVVEEAGPDGFAVEYHAQLRDVFAKQDLVPPYPAARVQALIDELHPSGRCVLLRARAGGRSVATAVFLLDGPLLYFWGGASRREDQHLRPNELLMWHAMRLGRDRGADELDLGGGGGYKRKYGVREVHVPHGRASRSLMVARLRDLGRSAFTARRRAAAAVQRVSARA